MSDVHGKRAAIVAEAGPTPGAPWTLLRYDTGRYPFAAVLSRDVFRVQDLKSLHVHVAAHREKHALPPGPIARDNLALRQMMQDLPDDSAFYRLYHRFMLRVLAPLVGSPLSYSSHPKMRVHLPGTGSVSGFHHDIVVTRRIDQVNFWLPVTDVEGGAALWLESTYGRGDFAPIPVRYGEVLIFDGGYLGHGSVRNDTETTRVSFDMRFSLKGLRKREGGVELMNRVLSGCRAI